MTEWKNELPRTFAYLQDARDALQSDLACKMCDLPHQREMRREAFQDVLDECRLDRSDLLNVPNVESAGELCDVPLELVLALSVLMDETLDHPNYVDDLIEPMMVARVFLNSPKTVQIGRVSEFAAALHGISLVTGQRDNRLEAVFVSLDDDSALALHMLQPAMAEYAEEDEHKLGLCRAHLRDTRSCVGFNIQFALPIMCERMRWLEKQAMLAEDITFY